MSYKANSKALGILTGITLGSGLLIILYYAYFTQKLFFIPFSFSQSENLYLSEILNKPKFFNLYSNLISKFISNNSILEILKTGRTLNIFALGLQLTSLMLIFKKEKVNFLASLISLLIFLSLSNIQNIFYQARPELWALGIGNLGLYLFMQNLKSLNLAKSIFISLFLGLPFLLTHQIGFLAFWLATVFTLLLLQNYQLAFKIFCPTLILGLINYKALLFKPEINALEAVYSWAFWCFAILLLFIQPNFKANFKHPAFILFFIGLIFALFQPSIWPIVFSALCWMIALFLHNLITNASPKNLYLISIFVLSLGIFTPLLEPVPLKLIRENPQIISKTLNWLNEQKNNSEQKILSEDFSLTSYLNSGKTFAKLPSLADLEKQQINKIILSAQTNSKQIKQNYIPTKRIFVLGSEGFVFETKWLESEPQATTSTDHKNTFATFHPIY